jgi:hypothetical protein
MCIATLVPRAAAAGSVPAGSVVRVDRAIDAAAFARTIFARYHVVLRRVVAADIDRDGDLDVVAATDCGFLVWVNDGSGRLTSQPPKPTGALDGHAPADTWSGDPARHDETIPNDPPSTPLPTTHAHGPPHSPSATLSNLTTVRRPAADRNPHTPRAPPSATL